MPTKEDFLNRLRIRRRPRRNVAELQSAKYGNPAPEAEESPKPSGKAK